MTLKSLLLTIFVLISIAISTNVALADALIKITTVKGKCTDTVDGSILCIGDEGVCHTISTIESSQPTSPTGPATVMTATAILLDPEGDAEEPVDEAIIDIEGIVPAVSIETMKPYQVLPKPTTWYGTKIEALQWLYQQYLLYNPNTP
jgi:hypothetical protein